MSGLKNPLAIRDGQIVTISDIADSEKGLACNCFCPNCGQRFIARKKDDLKVQHFAHEAGACDSVVSIMKGLYQLLVQFITQNGNYRYPDCYIHSSFPEYLIVDHQNAQQYIQISEYAQYGYDRIIQSQLIKDCAVEITYNAKDVPEAAILSYMGRKLALVIVQPAEICKTTKSTVKPYEDYATIILNHPADLYHSSSEKMINEMMGTQYWLSSPRIAEWIESSSSKHNEHVEERRRFKKALEEQHRKELEAQRIKEQEEQERIKRERVEQQARSSNALFSKPRTRVGEDGNGSGYYGRVLKCECCGMTKSASEFSFIPGTGDTGICSLCVRTGRYH